MIAWFFGHRKELEGAFSAGADLQEWAFCPHFQLWFELSSPPPANPFDWTPAHNSSILIVVNIGASWSTIIYTVRLPKRVRLQKKRCGFDVRCGYRISAAMVRVRFAGAVWVRVRILPHFGDWFRYILMKIHQDFTWRKYESFLKNTIPDAKQSLLLFYRPHKSCQKSVFICVQATSALWVNILHWINDFPDLVFGLISCYPLSWSYQWDGGNSTFLVFGDSHTSNMKSIHQWAEVSRLDKFVLKGSINLFLFWSNDHPVLIY